MLWGGWCRFYPGMRKRMTRRLPQDDWLFPNINTGGVVKFEETGDPSGKKWAKRGAIAGGVVGLIFPPSIILSAAVGAGATGTDTFTPGGGVTMVISLPVAS